MVTQRPKSTLKAYNVTYSYYKHTCQSICFKIKYVLILLLHATWVILALSSIALQQLHTDFQKSPINSTISVTSVQQENSWILSPATTAKYAINMICVMGVLGCQERSSHRLEDD